MAYFTFNPFVAVDPTNPQNVVQNGTGQVYALTDTGFTTPLPITDLADNELTELISNGIGLVQAFRADCADGQVVWASGEYAVPLMAPGAILAAAEAAAAAAAAAILSTVPAGGTTGQVLTKDTDSDFDTEWTTPQQFVVIGPSDDWPTGLPDGTIVIRTEV
jgi:hypothetical protein